MSLFHAGTLELAVARTLEALSGKNVNLEFELKRLLELSVTESAWRLCSARWTPRTRRYMIEFNECLTAKDLEVEAVTKHKDSLARQLRHAQTTMRRSIRRAQPRISAAWRRRPSRRPRQGARDAAARRAGDQ